MTRYLKGTPVTVCLWPTSSLARMCLAVYHARDKAIQYKNNKLLEKLVPYTDFVDRVMAAPLQMNPIHPNRKGMTRLLLNEEDMFLLHDIDRSGEPEQKALALSSAELNLPAALEDAVPRADCEETFLDKVYLFKRTRASRIVEIQAKWINEKFLNRVARYGGVEKLERSLTAMMRVVPRTRQLKVTAEPPIKRVALS